MKEAFNLVLERIKSPIYSFFIATWMIVNWKIVFIAFSFSFTTPQKVFFIDGLLVNINKTLWVPLGLTILYFLIYKWIEVAMQVYQAYLIEKKKFWQRKTQRKIPHSRDEYNKLIDELNTNVEKLQEIKQRNFKYEGEAHAKDTKINELEKDIIILKEKNEILPIINNVESLIGVWKYQTRKDNSMDWINEKIEIQSQAELQFYKILSGPKYDGFGHLISVAFFKNRLIFVLRHNDTTYFYYNFSKYIIDENPWDLKLKKLEGMVYSSDPNFHNYQIRMERDA